MNLFGRTNNKITKDQNVENVPHLETTKLELTAIVRLVDGHIVINDYQDN